MLHKCPIERGHRCFCNILPINLVCMNSFSEPIIDLKLEHKEQWTKNKIISTYRYFRISNTKRHRVCSHPDVEIEYKYECM